MLCHHYDEDGRFIFSQDDYNQPLPENATYVDLPEAKKDFIRVFKDGKWEYKEVDIIVKEDILSQKLEKLNNEYNGYFMNNDIAYITAFRTNNKELMKELDEEREALINQYAKTKEDITNDN